MPAKEGVLTPLQGITGFDHTSSCGHFINVMGVPRGGEGGGGGAGD